MSDPSSAPPVFGDRYQLTRRIARGGMADIYAAWDQTLDRTVAVKVLFPHFAADPTFVARFKREARSAGSLNHPNVVAVYDWGTYEDTYYIVMELIDGDSLAEVLRTEGPLSPEQAAYVTREVANALGFAHSNGMVHRDIKPGNIMLTSSGQVKVGDFGIARAYDGADDDLTQTGHVMGTAAYFSPEQAQGHTIDRRSDLYSLGVVLFEMLTGDKPFTGNSPVSVAYKHVEEQPPSVSSIRPDVPPDLERVVDILLTKRPEQRYDSSADLIADLDRIRGGLPILGVAGSAGSETVLADHGGVDATTALAADSGRTMVSPSSGEVTRALAEQADPYGGYGYDSGRMPVAVEERMVPGSRPASGGYPMADEQRPNRGGAFLAILLVVGLLAVVAAILLINVLGEGDTDAETTAVPVPTVLGETEESATRALENEGFVVDSVLATDEQLARLAGTDLEGAEPGIVIGQSPDGGEDWQLGEVVRITVVPAEEIVTVPDVVDQEQASAEQILRAEGLEPLVETEPDPEVEEGRVISQSPEAEDEVNPGSEVTIVVSSGPEAEQVPDVRGQTQQEAEQALTSAGFRVRIEQQRMAPDSEDIGRVVRQEPAGLQNAQPGSEITIFVGEAEESTTTTTPTTTQPATSTTRRSTTQTTQRPTTTAPPTTNPPTTQPSTTQPSTTETSSTSEPEG